MDELVKTLNEYFNDVKAHADQKLVDAQDDHEAEFYRGYLNALLEIRMDVNAFVSANVEDRRDVSRCPDPTGYALPDYPSRIDDPEPLRISDTSLL